MVVGEKRRMDPSEPRVRGASEARRGARGNFTFDVELLDIKVAPPPPPVPVDVAAAPASAKRTASGLAYRVLTPTTNPSAARPTASSTVIVNYTGSTTDGKMFDSSVTRGKPATFPLAHVDRRMDEGLQLMKVGDTARFWIPGNLAYDKSTRAGAPHGTLVFDVEELLGIEGARVRDRSRAGARVGPPLEGHRPRLFHLVRLDDEPGPHARPARAATGRCDDRLARWRRDFPTWRRFVYFPTLSWIYNADWLLASFAWLGLIAAGAAFAGGAHSPWAFFACYVLYLTLDRVLYLMFPWGLDASSRPGSSRSSSPLHLLPDVAAATAPDPALAWVYRLLLFRVLFGFGKFKFFGSTSEDTGYLKGFLVNQPLPSPVGWFMQKLPMPLLKLALYLMFLVEIPLPFAVFLPRWSIFAALAIDVFMLVIWSCGTFGYFSLVMMVVSLSWFDPQTALAFSVSAFFSPRGAVAIVLHALVFLHVLGAVMSFPLNSYCSMTWLNWPVWTRIRPRILGAPIVFYRALHPFRWLHSYGVFPPKPSPAVKAAPVMEVTWDGSEWHTLGHHYSPTLESSPPKFCSPHHARLDQSFIYDVFGLSDATVLRNLVGVWDPYAHTHAGGSWLMMRRALEGWIPSLLIDPKSIRRNQGPRSPRAYGRTCSSRPQSPSFAPRGAGGRRLSSAPTPVRSRGRGDSASTRCRRRSSGTSTTSSG